MTFKPWKLALPGWLCALILLATGCTTAPTLPPTQTKPPDIISPSPSPSPTPAATVTAIPPTPTSTIRIEPTLTPSPAPSFTPTITPVPTQIVDEKGIPMVLVPAGPFIMGTDNRARNERPAHKVTLDSFYIDQFEVSNAWFAQFLNAKGNQMEGNANWIEAIDPDLRVHLVDGAWRVDPGNDQFPMNEMTWYGARAFCAWRGGRLPTEAEWEKAARGTDGRTYPWGEGITCKQANYAGCFYAAVQVDSLPESASPYGAYNMAGNMMEWTADWYDPNYYGNSPMENPTGPEHGDFRLIRGGSWRHNAGNVRTTWRFPKLPVLTYATVGFRCARGVSP